MKYQGVSAPWPVVTVEVTTFDLRQILAAIDQLKRPDETQMRIRGDIVRVLAIADLKVREMRS